MFSFLLFYPLRNRSLSNSSITHLSLATQKNLPKNTEVFGVWGFRTGWSPKFLWPGLHQFRCGTLNGTRHANRDSPGYDGKNVWGLPRSLRSLQTGCNFVEPATGTEKRGGGRLAWPPWEKNRPWCFLSTYFTPLASSDHFLGKNAWVLSGRVTILECNCGKDVCRFSEMGLCDTNNCPGQASTMVHRASHHQVQKVSWKRHFQTTWRKVVRFWQVYRLQSSV